MMWFKHISSSLDDPFIFSLMEEFGPSGYLVFFGVLEIYAKEFSPENGWKLTEKWSYFSHKLLISRKKFKKILSKIHKWEIEFNGDMVTIFIPKFKSLMDESTLKKLRANRKSFRNDSGTFPKKCVTDIDIEEDIDKEKRKKKKEKREPHKYSSNFLIFWNAYPRKKNKGGAERAFKKINPNKDLLNEILSKLEQAKKSHDWQKNGGQFIPYPATWLNNRGWEDEINEKTANELKEFEFDD